GAQCQTPICSPACGSNATCSAPNTCTCNAGWGGAQCQTPICSPACGSNATCTAPNTCTCNAGWEGSQCQTPICEHECINGGSCISPNTCECPEEWEGQYCQRPKCQITCKEREQCVAPNECGCIIGWQGADCDLPDRIPIHFENIFKMGALEEDKWATDEEKPRHQVKLSPYWIDRYPVTAAAYEMCVKAGACRDPREGEYSTFKKQLDHPINYVTWWDAESYCKWASSKGRLPTEAEWEYAAKGHNDMRFVWGEHCPKFWNGEYCSEPDSILETMLLANCEKDYCKDPFEYTNPVNTEKLSSNMSEFGVMGMTGNVREWTMDWHGVYEEHEQEDPKGPEHGPGKVVRGGSFKDNPNKLRNTARMAFEQDYSDSTIGFRCVHTD
ncbi:MAG: SUMF1/EgtB/PvdO family nonheme iron enzyme, partial [Bradymonadales bacterium]